MKKLISTHEAKRSAPRSKARAKASTMLVLSILLISALSFSAQANAQTGLSGYTSQWDEQAYNACILDCGNEPHCPGLCEAAGTGAAVGGAIVGAIIDPIGTLDDIFGGGSDSTDVTSFTEFSGGLTQPSTAGYSAGLVQQTSAREFALQVTNFILGFLGLIAIIIIIYGGFIYVTAAGETDKTEKGKKSVVYAVVGIIIILASYAIVNTILLAPQGSDTGQLSGSAPGEFSTGSESEQSGSTRSLFNFAASEVKSIATDFLSSYQNFAETRLDILNLERIPKITNKANLNSLLQSKKTIIQNISTKAGSLSHVNEKAKTAMNVINIYIQVNQASSSDNAEWLLFWNIAFPTFQTEFGDAIGENGLAGASNDDFALKVVKARERIEELKDQIVGDDGPASTLNEVSTAFDDVLGEFNNIASGDSTAFNMNPIAILVKLAHAQTSPSLLNPNIKNTEVVKILEKMANLHDLVENILFVHAVVTTDVAAGNAPLYVTFDGLKSLDPNNQTLTDYEWDFGDANADPASNPNGAIGATTNHIFKEPGTYIIKLIVRSKSTGEVANGIAYGKVTVKPPTSKIYLSAQIGQELFVLRDYSEETGTLIVDRDTLKVSPSEASAGIIFNAEKTDDSKMSSVRWDFGDNTSEILGSGQSLGLKQTHAYTEQGNYTMLLEVTDKQGNKDRKIVNIVVDTPIARYNVEPGNYLRVNEKFEIDGSSSTSDGGQITTWEWLPSDTQTMEIEGSTKFETLKAKYTEPGLNQITLKISDNLDGEDSETIRFVIESEAPKAQFQYEIPKESQPSTVEFNGKLSYDPDGDAELQYKWEVDGQTSGSTFQFVDGTTEYSPIPKIKFKEVGTFSVALTAIDPNGYGTGKEQSGDPVEKEVIIDTVLDIEWGSNDDPTTALKVDGATGEASAIISLSITSEKGIAYEINWGDGETETGNIIATKTLTHNYSESGAFAVQASVFDAEDNENSVSRKIFISSSDTPIGVATVKVNGNEIFDTTGVITVGRKDTVSFDASKSLNTDGTGRRLKYSWDFGNGQKSAQEKSNQQYKEIGTYEVQLKVTNINDVSQNSPVDKVTIEVVGQPPILRGITAIPTGTSLITPVTFTVNAVGAEDPDGKVTRYKWWYYDPDNDTDQLGIQVTQSPIATLTIGTRGVEGEEKTYKFAVELTDDENNTARSSDIIDEDSTATINVENGPNKAPVASFKVDRTSIMVGESINFSSSSSDTDGTITDYYWDFEGDGFANNTEPLGSNVSYKFEQGAPNGIKVRLKVKDNNESEATSDPITIYVDTIAKDPVAAFTSEQVGDSKKVKFTDTSEPDEESGLNIAKWKWDFDANTDSNGDGSKDNDADSTVQNPEHVYTDYSIYRVKLSIEDNEKGTDEITNFVNVRSSSSTTTETLTTVTTPTTTTQIDARLLTTPAASSIDGKIHLQGESGDITFDYSTSKGDIATYIIDKNIYFDTNGNGIKTDDEDHKSTKAGKWTTHFNADYGKTRVRLTVIGKDGKKDIVEKDIVFNTSAQASMMANMFKSSTNSAILIALVSIWGFVILNSFYNTHVAKQSAPRKQPFAKANNNIHKKKK